MYKVPDACLPPIGAVARRLDEAGAAQSRLMASPARSQSEKKGSSELFLQTTKTIKST
jgi:hypothetical protein